MLARLPPAYSILDDKQAQEVSRSFPHTKIICILRNPVRRHWSAALAVTARHRRVDAIPAEEFLAAFHHPGAILRSDFEGFVPRWQNLYGEDLHLCFLDDVAKDPEAVLTRLCFFLGGGSASGINVGFHVQKGTQSGGFAK